VRRLRTTSFLGQFLGRDFFYVVLAVPRSRWCWVAGGVGSLIYVWLFARARLPMQSLLQVWYVGVAVFGFLRWSRDGTMPISLLSWRGHVAHSSDGDQRFQAMVITVSR
jgi:nicotinamide mononucleotide transporter